MYTADAAGKFVASATIPPLPTAFDTYSFQSGDWNGDGLSDLVAFRKNAGTSYFYTSTASSFTQTYAATGMHGGTAELLPADYNGDGNTDLFLKDKAGSGNSYIYLAEGDGTFAAATYTVSGWGDYNAVVGDWNGDGKADLGRVHKTNTSLTNFYYSTGLGLSGAIYSPAWGKDWDVIAGDWNGDGLTDLYRVKTDLDKDVFQYKTTHSGFDVIDQITDGLGAAIDVTYAALTDGAVHTQSTGSSYPTLDIQAPLYVVSSLKEDDGLGGQSETTYKYSGAKVHVEGYGFLGFATVQATEAATGLISKTTYSQAYPFRGLATRAEVLQPDLTPMSVVATTYASIETHAGKKTFFPFVDINANESYELDGSLVTKVTTNSDYDTFGNPTNIFLTTMDGTSPPTETFTTTTASDYHNDTTNWFLGRLICTRVTQTVPGPTTATRTSGFEYNATTGLLTREVIEPTSGDITEVGGVANCVTGSTDLNIAQRTDYAHDRFGNTTTVTVDGDAVPALRTTTTAWGELDDTDTLIADNGRFAVQVTNALDHDEFREYDGRHGKAVRLKGPNGLETEWDHDTFGRQLKETRADNTETNQTRAWCTAATCPSDGKLKLVATATGAPSTAGITDILGRERITAQVGFEGSAIVAETEYNALGQVKRKTLPYFDGNPKYWHQFTAYDLAGRSTMELLPDGVTETETTYNGLSVTVTNGLGQASTRTNNARGELVTATDADNEDAHYRYDSFGNLREVEDTNGNKIIAEFDIRGRKIRMNDPDMSPGTGANDVWKYEYNGLGELTKQTDAKGQVVTTTYDDLGRPKTRTESLGTDVTTWTYDTATKGVGKPATLGVTGADAISKSFAYDANGRPQSTTTTIDGTAYTVEQTYDPSSRLDTITYPQRAHDSGRFKVRYSYNAQSYQRDVRDDATNALYWQADMRDAAGQLEEFTLGNAITTSQRFDPETGLIETIQSSSPLGVFDIQDYSYEFDVIGNLKKRKDIDQGLTETFGYDNLNRLENATFDDGVNPPTTKSYTYDALGNIGTKAGISGTYLYGQNHAQCSNDVGPHAVTTAGGQQFCYDANGNMTDGYNFTRQRARTLTWTSYNKPRSITEGPGAVTLDFYYDEARARFKQVNSTGLTTFYVGSLYEKQVTASQTTHVLYVRAGGSSVAIHREHDDNNAETRYIHRDHIGSITEITDETALLAEELSYDPHGKRREIDWEDALNQVEAVETARCFTGHEYLDDVSLIHMNGRIYDPDLGRFLSPDPFIQEPANAQNLNRYTYVLNNPLSFTDPSGFFFGKLFKSIFKAIKSVFKAIRSVIRAIGKNIRLLGAIAASIAIPNPYLAGFAAEMIASGGDLKAGIIGALTAGAFDALGGVDFVKHFGKEFAGVVKVVSHGVVGGVSSELSGGNFLSGFLSGGFVTAVGGVLKGIPTRTEQLIASAVVGGIAAEMGGGKFANGALTGAFAYAFGSVTERIGDDDGIDYGAFEIAEAQGAFNVGPNSLVDSEQFFQCVNTCIDQNYSIAWETAQSLSPITVPSLAGN